MGTGVGVPHVITMLLRGHVGKMASGVARTDSSKKTRSLSSSALSNFIFFFSMAIRVTKVSVTAIFVVSRKEGLTVKKDIDPILIPYGRSIHTPTKYNGLRVNEI